MSTINSGENPNLSVCAINDSHCAVDSSSAVNCAVRARDLSSVSSVVVLEAVLGLVELLGIIS